MSVAGAILTRNIDALPGRRDEDWRWSDVRALYRAIPEPSPASSGAGLNPLFVGFQGAEALYVNGRPVSGGADRVSAGEDARLLRRFVSAADDCSHHLAVDLVVEEDARLVLIDSFEGSAHRYLASFSGTLTIRRGARVERLVVFADADDAVSISRLDVELDAGAQFAQTVLMGGALRQRAETRVRQTGGARLRLDGVSLVGDARHCDQTTSVEHHGRGGTSEQLVKTVAGGQARAVFQGRIVVSAGADGTNARMGSHALIVSDRAECDAKPELEIYADDVQCAHGNTVGALDTEALFYMRTRGIPEAVARAMLTTAFVGAVVERIEDDDARAIADKAVSARLGSLW